MTLTVQLKGGAGAEEISRKIFVFHLLLWTQRVPVRRKVFPPTTSQVKLESFVTILVFKLNKPIEINYTATDPVE